ncbi:presenilin-associated rhomboid-like protein, mitochondrial isoform 2-T2 [Vipera latastei]
MNISEPSSKTILKMLKQIGWIEYNHRKDSTSENRLIFGGTVLATGNGLCQCDFYTHIYVPYLYTRVPNAQIYWTGIIAANVFVFCLWRIPTLSRIMVTYFTSNPASRVLCFPMLLSTFSHFSLLHMVANMYVLWSFSTSIVSILGREQFMAVYLSAGVFSTFVSYVCKMATGKFGPSLGASGAIMAVLGAVCTKIPEAKLAIIFLPMFTFTAGNALKAVIALDSVGLILGWRFFDHASHLGGVLFGIWYVMYGNKLIWNNREPVVKAWHTVKTWRPNK